MLVQSHPPCWFVFCQLEIDRVIRDERTSVEERPPLAWPEGESVERYLH